MPHFEIKPEWRGETVAILGGGPSLNAKDVAEVRARSWRRIACNDAFRLDPEADVVCWNDVRWYQWNRREVDVHTGLKITWDLATTKDVKANLMRKRPSPPHLSIDPTAITATNTGQGAINVAFHFGVKRIVLLGFDMRVINGRNNWHAYHKGGGPAATAYSHIFGPAIAKAGAICEKKGIEIINATEMTALRCFPVIPLRKVK